LPAEKTHDRKSLAPLRPEPQSEEEVVEGRLRTQVLQSADLPRNLAREVVFTRLQSADLPRNLAREVIFTKLEQERTGQRVAEKEQLAECLQAEHLIRDATGEAAQLAEFRGDAPG
jgi:hypothetical protein